MQLSSIMMAIIILLIFVMMPLTMVRAEELPQEYRAATTKGLDWLARVQHRDGHWETAGGDRFNDEVAAGFPVAMTGIAGMALLMEGSTLREGKYRDNIRRAVDWLMARSQPNGLIGNPNNASEGVRYIYGHGYAMMFLACIVGEEEDAERRARLVDILERAATFSHHAQSSRGGWGYLSCRDSPNDDEGSTTITQLQGLRAARNAGIIVPNAAIKDAIRYLHDATNDEGGVMYSLARGGGGGEARPTLTAAAIACSFSTGEYDSTLVKKWFKYCRSHLPFAFNDNQKMGHDEYTYYYFAQAVYMLGEDGWAKLFPDDPKPLRWSEFSKASFDTLIRSQASDGSWGGGNINWVGGNRSVGPVYATAAFLSVMQLDKAVLPLYQR